MAQFHESPVAQVLRIQPKFTNAGVNIGSMRLFFQYTLPSPAAADCVTIANAFVTSYTTHIIPLTHPNTSLDTVVVTDLNTVTGFQGIVAPKTPGTAAGTELPVSNSVLVNYLVPIRYRGGKPKNFVPAGVAANTADGKHWSTAFQSTFANAWQGLITDMTNPGTGTTLKHAYVKYYQGHQPDPTPTTWGPVNVPMPLATPQVYNISGHTVNLIIGSQRRRLRHEA